MLDNTKLEQIKKDMSERIGAQPDARFSTEDEVNICWLIAEIEQLKKKIQKAKNCLVCAAIADAAEVCQNTLEILEGEAE